MWGGGGVTRWGAEKHEERHPYGKLLPSWTSPCVETQQQSDGSATVVVLVSVDVCACVCVSERGQRNWKCAYPMSFGIYFQYCDNIKLPPKCVSEFVREQVGKQGKNSTVTAVQKEVRGMESGAKPVSSPLSCPLLSGSTAAALWLGCVQTTSGDPSVSVYRELGRP